MGMHASGEVFFGLDLRDLTNDDYEEIGPAWVHEGEIEWEDVLAEKRGHARVEFPTHAWVSIEGQGLDESHPDAITYRAWRNAVRQVEQSSLVELGTYGHVEGETYWCVQVKASIVRSEYDAVPLTLEAADDWTPAVLAFCEELGLPVPEGAAPGWLLTSSYG